MSATSGTLHVARSECRSPLAALRGQPVPCPCPLLRPPYGLTGYLPWGHEWSVASRCIKVVCTPAKGVRVGKPWACGILSGRVAPRSRSGARDKVPRPAPASCACPRRSFRSHSTFGPWRSPPFLKLSIAQVGARQPAFFTRIVVVDYSVAMHADARLRP